MLTVITGPPCAGKSTYVRNHAAAGDIVVDFDELARALGSPHSHDHPRAVSRVAQAAWHSAVGAAIARHAHGDTVWIIDSRPSPSRWQRYNGVGAAHVHLDADRAELARRATAAGRSPATLRRIAAWKDVDPAPVRASRTW